MPGASVLPEVQIQESRRGSISVAIIRTAGQARSEYWAPFRDQTALAAYAISETEIIAYGQKGRLAVYDLAAARTVRECETGQNFGKCQIAPDRRWLWILFHNRVTCWETSSLLRTALFDAVELKGEVRKVLSSGDEGFFSRLSKGEVLFFQSIREICVLRDGRLCVANDGREPALFLVAMPSLEVEMRPVTGPLYKAVKELDLPEDTFLQWATDPGVESFVRALAAGRLSLSGFTERAISTALDRTAAQFELGIAKYISNDTLSLVYPYKDREVDEEELFSLIVEKRLKGTVPALRRLLLAYLAAVKAKGLEQPWYDGDQGMAALCHALRALMLLDAGGSYDVMRAYMNQRDPEHESFSADVLFPEMKERDGWAGEDDVRFGVFVALNSIRGGRGPAEAVWNVGGLIDAARSIVPGARFAELVLEEISDGCIQSVWPDQGPVYELQGLLSVLPSDSGFSNEVIERLEAWVPGVIGLTRSH
jgi:hypothetical protein